jgi:ABC-type transporter Mla MlaB component
MLRIARRDTAELSVLVVEGHVMGPWVEELRRAGQAALARRLPVRLDLAGVTFLDRGGVELLLELGARQVALAGAPGFVAEQLRAGRGAPSRRG